MKRVIHKLKPEKSALLTCFVLALMVWGIFGQTLHHEFVNFDDNLYVYDNPDVELGLSRTGIEQAFTKRYVSIWLPLTMISYQLDYELGGMNPSGFHRTNVWLHTATAILLFLLLRSMTGSLWRSAFVAALFAVHPLRAESVAWISERKDVLSSLFFMLTLGAYARYVRKGNGGQKTGVRGQGSGNRKRCNTGKIEKTDGSTSNNPYPISNRRFLTSGAYGLVVVFFILGLLSKPMLITLPFVLLLLDYWPLGRFGNHGVVEYGSDGKEKGTQQPVTSNQQPFFRLVVEKIPLFLLSVVFCAVAIWAQQNTITLEKEVPFLWRIGNAAVSYVVYIKQMILLSGLNIFYPHPGTELPLWQVAASFLFLTLVSLAIVFAQRKHPYLAVGWLWYLGMLVPVIGILPAWQYAHADRYTYLPQIGLAVLLAWGIAKLSVRWKHRRQILGAAAALVLITLSIRAWVQTSIWRDSETVWTHALAHTKNNNFANYNLAVVLERKGERERAIEHYQRALQARPKDTEALINLGCALAEKNELEAAEELFRRALEIKPNSPEAHTDLGIVLAKQGDVESGIEHLKQALEIKPDYLEARINLGVFLAKQGKIETAIEQYRQALKIEPDSADTHHNLGLALAKQGNTEEAIAHFQQAWEIDPDSVAGQRSLDLTTRLFMNQIERR